MRLATVALLVANAGCTAIDFTRVPSGEPGRIFITQAALTVPYESMGLIQVTRRGVRLFGFVDPAGTDLEAAVAELEPQVRAARADGVMNARVQMQQYTTAAKIVGLVLFFAPLPAEVTITGEMVRLRRAAAPTGPSTAPAGVPL